MTDRPKHEKLAIEAAHRGYMRLMRRLDKLQQKQAAARAKLQAEIDKAEAYVKELRGDA